MNRKHIVYAALHLTAMWADAGNKLLGANDYVISIYAIDREQKDGLDPLAQDFFAKIGAVARICLKAKRLPRLFAAVTPLVFGVKRGVVTGLSSRRHRGGRRSRQSFALVIAPI